MEWLASKGALVWIPMGHSPDADVMAELDGRLLRIQVKTTTMFRSRSGAEPRWIVSIATNGGNQSWTGTTKKFSAASVDYLFVLVGDGRRWFMPATAVEAGRAIAVGGAKYSEFEIENGTPFEALIYPSENLNRIVPPHTGECQSGQMDVTVNHAAMPTEVRILSPPSPSRQVVLRPKRQATIPRLPCEEADLRAGDRLRVRADGPGRVVFERIDEAADPGTPEPPV